MTLQTILNYRPYRTHHKPISYHSMITYPFSLFIDIFVYLSNSFWVWGDHNETSHYAEEEIKTHGHRAVLSQKAPSSELSSRKQLSRLWSYGETGPTFLEDNLAFSQGWHSFMLFPPLPESCCHRVLLKQAGLRVAISINMVCLIVQCLLSTDCPWNTRCTSCQSITSSKRRTVSPCIWRWGKESYTIVVLVFLHQLGLW